MPMWASDKVFNFKFSVASSPSQPKGEGKQPGHKLTNQPAFS